MEQKDMYYNKAEYIETVSMGSCPFNLLQYGELEFTEFINNLEKGLSIV